MTSLQSFIDYKNNCPICDCLLSLSFIFKSKNKIQIVDNNVVAAVEISGYTMSPKSYQYTALIHINPENNDFYINFLDKNGKQYDRLFLSVKDRYFSFIKANESGIRFYKECLVCRKYNYTSNIIHINHKKCKLENLDIKTEYWCLGKNVKSDNDKNIKVYKLINNYLDDRATIMTGIVSSTEFEKMGAFNVAEKMLPNFVETHAINLSNITDSKQLMEKLNLFMTLS